MTDIVEDVATITTIPKEALKKLNEKYKLAIGYALNESIKGGKLPADLDIGLGRLLIEDTDDEIQYRQQ